MRQLTLCLFVTLLASAPVRAEETPPDSEERLVEEANAIASDRALRPSHVQPALPGTLAERARPALARMEVSRKLLQVTSQEEAALLLDVRWGRKPLSALPRAWAEALRADGPALHEVLLASRAESGDLGPGMTVFETLQPHAGNFMPYQHAAKLAGYEAIRLAGEGRTVEAAEVCADALALARDCAHRYLVGRMISIAMVGIVVPACHTALRTAPAPDRRRLTEGVTRVLAGWSGFAGVLAQERVFGELHGFGDTLSDQTRRQLPPQASLLIEAGEKSSRDGVGKHVRRALFGSWGRRKYVRAMLQLEAAQALPPEQADAQMDRFNDEVAFSSAVLGDDYSSGNWKAFARRDRDGLARIQALLAITAAAVFQAEHGRWPRDLAECGPAAASANRPLAYSAEGGQARVAIVVVGAEGDETFELTAPATKSP